MSLFAQIAAWESAAPGFGGGIGVDDVALASWHLAYEECAADGATNVQAARARWRTAVRRTHASFLRVHRREIFDAIEEPSVAGVLDACRRVAPALVGTSAEYVEERQRALEHKRGVEYKAAIVLADLLTSPVDGTHFIDSARAPLASSREALARFVRDDRYDAGGARARREGTTAIVEVCNPWALNAEDESVLDSLEQCIDVALLDDRVRVGVLRGGPVLNAKYRGRRVFCSGIDLHRLHRGELSYEYYVKREIGLVNKLHRGLWLRDEEREIEKPWLAAVDTHAIGGGCQLLLVMDYVVAESGSFMSIPAQKEGIIPGAANLRLPRFVGARAARSAILLDRRIPAESQEATYLVDEVVGTDDLDAAIERGCRALQSSGLECAIANRKALRLAQEPADRFREYMAHFALAQADCYFSPTLVRNLEERWLRRPKPIASPTADAGSAS